MNGVSKLSVTEDISLVNFKNIPRDLCISSRIKMCIRDRLY